MMRKISVKDSLMVHRILPCTILQYYCLNNRSMLTLLGALLMLK